jgi:hypothetical protein
MHRQRENTIISSTQYFKELQSAPDLKHSLAAVGLVIGLIHN